MTLKNVKPDTIANFWLMTGFIIRKIITPLDINIEPTNTLINL